VVAGSGLRPWRSSLCRPQDMPVAATHKETSKNSFFCRAIASVGSDIFRCVASSKGFAPDGDLRPQMYQSIFRNCRLSGRSFPNSTKLRAVERPHLKRFTKLTRSAIGRGHHGMSAAAYRESVTFLEFSWIKETDCSGGGLHASLAAVIGSEDIALPVRLLIAIFMVYAPHIAQAAEVQCSHTSGQVTFFFSGSGGNGPGILRVGDTRFAMECRSFVCVAEPRDGIAIGAKLEFTPSPELVFARVGSPERPYFDVQRYSVDCEIS